MRLPLSRTPRSLKVDWLLVQRKLAASVCLGRAAKFTEPRAIRGGRTFGSIGWNSLTDCSGFERGAFHACAIANAVTRFRRVSCHLNAGRRMAPGGSAQLL
jgi:hypothetical protein